MSPSTIRRGDFGSTRCVRAIDTGAGHAVAVNPFRSGLKSGIKHAARRIDALRPVAAQANITILIYHRVGQRTVSEVDLPVELFDAQLSWLAEHCEVVDFDTAVARLRTPAPAGERPVVTLTFDDGTADFTEVAVPLLADHGLPALVYVATAFVDEGRDFPFGARAASWAALRDARDAGVTFGSHTHEHLLLDRVDASTAEADIARSCDLLSFHLGCEVKHFAYPKAVAPSGLIDGIVRARFESAAVAGTRSNVAGDCDLHLLARSPIQLSDGMEFFVAKAHGGMRFEDNLRRLANRRRYAGATT